MHLSGTARRVIAVAIALQASLAITVLGAGGADAAAGCAGVTGHLVDHGTTVTAVFHVPTTCAEVSVLSWFATDAAGGQPQHLAGRKSADNVASGDYQWTIAAPPAACFRQLDLRVPGRNVDSIVGGDRRCSPSSPTPPPPSPKPVPDTDCTHWNVTAQSHEVVGDRYVQHFTLNATCVVTVVSFTATGPSWPDNGPQVPFDRWKGTRGPGAHTESVALPPCFFQADLVVDHRVLDTATGGTGPCATKTPPVPSPVTPHPRPPPRRPAPPTPTPPPTVPGEVAPLSLSAPTAPSAVAPLRIVAPIARSTRTPAAVLGLVITPPGGAAAPLPRTGGQQAGLAGVGLTGMAIGFGLLTAGRKRARALQPHRARR